MQVLLDTLKNTQITPTMLETFAKYFSIIHHTKGRIRLRASKRLKEDFKDEKIDLEELLEVVKSIPAIKNIKINKIIGSLLVEYDINVLEPIWWEEWFEGRELQVLSNKLNSLIQGI
ncbi:HMA2 domain-containing protein [Helicobacter burdigaliensis]|uniref:HMA2 domain-containing protein n=1 Tax=Helicobacter burdigaliensis TaxID=2315334 RepID=UPI000EF682CA|nr:hypothetical protein [Helicobacter burdigaliensis]